MISIPKHIAERMVAQAREEAPLEACGLLAGLDSEVRKVYPMTNVDASREHFSLDPAEQFVVVKDARALGLEIIALYHSHPESPARMSKEDLRLAFTPGLRYVIVSLMTSDRPEIRGFRVVEGKAVEEEVQLDGAW